MELSFKNKNGRKRMLQIKETREIVILSFHVEYATLKQTINGICGMMRYYFYDFFFFVNENMEQFFLF